MDFLELGPRRATYVFFSQHLCRSRNLILGGYSKCQVIEIFRGSKIQRNRGVSVRIMSEIMEVPFPRADSKRLINFLTFQISIFFSTSFPCCWELILGDAKVQYHQRGGMSMGPLACRRLTGLKMGRRNKGEYPVPVVQLLTKKQ